MAESEISEAGPGATAVPLAVPEAEEAPQHGVAGGRGEAGSEGAAVVQLDHHVTVVGGDCEVMPGQADTNILVVRGPVAHHHMTVRQTDGEVSREEDQTRVCVLSEHVIIRHQMIRITVSLEH